MKFESHVEGGGSVAHPTPAQALGISERELEALLLVRDQLASDALVHVVKLNEEFSSDYLDRLKWLGAHRAFNMGIFWERRGCGSVGCIGGWMCEALGLDDMTKISQGVLRPLFYPRGAFTYGAYWGFISPGEAVEAIDNFTTHTPGDPGWEPILKRVKGRVERHKHG